MNKSINVQYIRSNNKITPKFMPMGDTLHPEVIFAKTVYHTDWITNIVLDAIQRRINLPEVYGSKIKNWTSTFDELAEWTRQEILIIWETTYFMGYQCSEFLRVWFIDSIRIKWLELQRTYGDVVPDLYDSSEVIPVKVCMRLS